MGELPLLETWELSKDAWRASTSNPDFFVVADMWNSWSRWHRVETPPHLVNRDILIEITAMLLDWPEWCVYMALGKGGLTIFSNRILYEGVIFQDSNSIAELARRCHPTD